MTTQNAIFCKEKGSNDSKKQFNRILKGIETKITAQAINETSDLQLDQN